MKSLSLGLCILALCLAVTALLAAHDTLHAQTGDVASDSTPQALVEGRCAACHSLQRICDKLAFKTLDEWTATVTRMVQKGIPFSDAEITYVSEYLDSLEPGDKAVCE